MGSGLTFEEESQKIAIEVGHYLQQCLSFKPFLSQVSRGHHCGFLKGPILSLYVKYHITVFNIVPGLLLQTDNASLTCGWLGRLVWLHWVQHKYQDSCSATAEKERLISFSAVGLYVPYRPIEGCSWLEGRLHLDVALLLDPSPSSYFLLPSSYVYKG